MAEQVQGKSVGVVKKADQGSKKRDLRVGRK